MDWTPIKFSDFMRVPRGLHSTRYVYEVSSLGEVRLYNPLGDRIFYKPVKLETIQGIDYLHVTIGQAYGIVIKTSIPIKRIIGAYFGKK